jgi:hypothetical protein
MQQFPPRPVYEAIADVEVSLGIYLLLLDEEGPDGPHLWAALERLKGSLAEVQRSRELATELAADTGLPALHVIDGGR